MASTEHDALLQIVRVLNGEGDKEHPLHPGTCANLIKLVQAWQQAKHAPNESNPVIRRRLRFEQEHGAPIPTLLKMEFPPGCPSWHEIEKRCRSLLALSGTGVVPQLVYDLGRNPTAWKTAVDLFLRLITNPLRDKVPEPCPHCKKYFIRKTERASVYCSRSCASRSTAIRRTYQVREERHNKKLAVANEAIRKWDKLASGGRVKKPWKEWVCDYEPAVEISIRFLTRALNKGEIQAPKLSRRDES